MSLFLEGTCSMCKTVHDDDDCPNFPSSRSPAGYLPAGFDVRALPDGGLSVSLPDGGFCVVRHDDKDIPRIVLYELAKALIGK